MAKGYASFSKKGEGRALIELARNYTPENAIREFVTNSIDARLDKDYADISIAILPKSQRVMITDNCSGMDFYKLDSLPRKIGESEKDGTDKRGEKALGLLAFGTLGRSMQMISRPKGGRSNDYNYMIMQLDEINKTLPYETRVLSPSDVEKNFGGIFTHGTRIIIDGVDPHTIQKILTIGNLKKHLRMTYNPALKAGIVDLTLANYDQKGNTHTEKLEPIEYQREGSSLLLDEIIDIPIKNDPNPGKLEVCLFINPDALDDKAAVYSKDVLVYRSLAELTEFSRSGVWASGKISGFVNDRFNKLILGRLGIDRQRNAFKAWYDAVKSLEDRIRPEIESRKNHIVKKKDMEFFRDMSNTLEQIWRDFEKGYGHYTRGKAGVLTPVVGIEPTDIRHRGPREPQVPTPPVVGRPAGPGAFIEEQPGVIVRVVPRRSPFPFRIEPRDFPNQEMDLRSKMAQMISPTILINTLHEDYTRISSLKNDPLFLSYNIDLVSKEVAYYEAQRILKEAKVSVNSEELARTALDMSENMKYLFLKARGF